MKELHSITPHRYRSRFFAGFGVGLMAVINILNPIAVSAQINQLDFSANDINYYDPRARNCTVGASSELEGYTLPAVQGKTGIEKEIDQNGIVLSGPDKGKSVTFGGLAKGVAEKHGADALNYYITMRWNYAAWSWNGSASDIDHKQWNWMNSKPRIVLVTNPSNHKSIYAVALEAGPAPWTGVDNYRNNDPKQDWKNPMRGTPPAYTGRVSGFPQKALDALEADQGMANGDGDVLQYSWAANQDAKPGPTNDTAGGSTAGGGSSCAGQGVGYVNADGYAFPIGLGKNDVSNGYSWPCRGYCHHDETPAFDLAHKETVRGDADQRTTGVPTYAIYKGIVESRKDSYRGVVGCNSIQLAADDGWKYAYLHIDNAVKEGTKVNAGAKVAQVGPRKCTGNGSYPHLHIDRGSPKGRGGGADCCRDPGFVDLLNSIYESMPG